ncbi:TKL family protein kinase [Tritrichomonas foetus]|uniref:TKL family protein kinase n=1 Tax=Tritrichomonas foetus TaxID=1144522 RepID=A0A1J4KUH1_9EUKA|nr:TKL family protein kinase [Tritrichomonas foetus]|eukprot:OHT13310.1 TKL family protein kinase [Tritrichomonas foetus]
MTSAITPFSQWVQTLRYDIMNILQSYKNVCVHKAKLACLCTELHQFYKVLSTKAFPSKPPNPSEASQLRNLVSLVSNLRQIYLSFNQNRSIVTLMQSPPQTVVDNLNNFRNQFNKLVMSLKLASSEPCNIDLDQQRTDDCADCKQIVEILTNYIKQNKLNKEHLTELNKRLSEYTDNVNRYENEIHEENAPAGNHVLTSEEVEEKMGPLRKWQVKHEDFELQKKIGAGGFADVYSGYQKSTKKVVAIKKLHDEEFTTQTFNMFLREVEIIGTLQHFAVLPFVGVCLTPPFYIITEFMSGGCLFQRIHAKDTRLDGTKKTIIALGIAYAMQYIHSMNYLHRDLKSLNILLDADDYPKVCDFGMSRTMPEDDQKTLLTGGAGTVQWMAPEVLNSDPYDKKADVYSYGIMLWEIMTCEVPFRGLRDVQIAMAVVGNGSRPMIPADNVGRLGRFIKMCWDQDPSKRPTFDSIVAAFESGNIYYPGTNMNVVTAYKTRFNTKTDQVTPTVSKVKSKNLSPESLIEQLKAPETMQTALMIIASKIKKKKFIEEISGNKDLIAELIKVCEDCQSAEMARNIFIVFLGISKHSKILTIHQFQKVLAVFVQFGNTQMVEILEFLSGSMPLLEQLKLNNVHFTKFAAFLQSSDISLRADATKLLYKLIKHNIYDRPESLKPILSFVIKNSNSDSIPDLLLPSLKVVNTLLPLKDLYAAFTSCGIFQAIFSIFTTKQSSKVTKAASKALSLIINKVDITEEELSSVILGIPEAVNKLSTDALPQYVAIFAHLLRVQTFYKSLVNTSAAAECIGSILESKSNAAVLLGLKLCFALLKNESTKSLFATISESYLKLVTSTIAPISAVASACLIQSASDLSILLNKSIEKFLCNTLSSENEMTLNSLRICGAIASTPEGAYFLETKEIVKLVKNFVNSENGMIQKLALMVFAAYSSSNPTSKASLEVVDTFIAAMKFEPLQPYAIIFLSNVVIHPDGAIACAQQLAIFGNALQSESSIVLQGALHTLIRIVSCPEASAYIRDSTPIIEIYRVVNDHLKDNLFSTCVDLVSGLSGTVPGKRALGETNLQEKLKKKLKKLNPYDPLKSTVLRILARCE